MMAKFVITKPYTAKSRPIIFNAEMVRAILDGRKTQTRRVIKKDFIINPEEKYPYNIRGKYALWNSFKTLDELVAKFCPYGVPGDFLWVRETWATGKGNNFAKPSDLPRGSIIFYKDDESKFESPTPPNWVDPEKGKWRPSIFMPRWASRITLKITEIRVERVQEISYEDIRKEGIEKSITDVSLDMKLNFINLWDSINAKKGYGWDEKPWVWTIEFERIGDEQISL